MANDEQWPNEITVVNVPESGRYELRDGEKTIGLSEYRVRRGRIIFTHTEVDPGYGGQGLGSIFARHMLDEAAGDGWRIVPVARSLRLTSASTTTTTNSLTGR